MTGHRVAGAAVYQKARNNGKWQPAAPQMIY